MLTNKPKNLAEAAQAFVDLARCQMEVTEYPSWVGKSLGRHYDDIKQDPNILNKTESTVVVSRAHGNKTLSIGVCPMTSRQAYITGKLINGYEDFENIITIRSYDMPIVSLVRNSKAPSGFEILFNESARSYSVTTRKHYYGVTNTIRAAFRDVCSIYEARFDFGTMARYRLSLHNNAYREITEELMALHHVAASRYRQEWYDTKLQLILGRLEHSYNLATHNFPEGFVDKPAKQQQDRLSSLLEFVKYNLVGAQYKDGASLILAYNSLEAA